MKRTAAQKKELYKLAVARSNITDALFMTRYLLKNVKSLERDFELHGALVSAIVSAYARTFTKNDPYGAISEKYGRFDDPELQALHSAILRSRNKSVAHSDMEVRALEIVPPGAEIIPGQKTDSLGLSIAHETFPRDAFSRVEQLCLEVGNRLNERVKNLLEEMYGGEDWGEDPEPFRLDFEDEEQSD